MFLLARGNGETVSWTEGEEVADVCQYCLWAMFLVSSFSFRFLEGEELVC